MSDPVLDNVAVARTSERETSLKSQLETMAKLAKLNRLYSMLSRITQAFLHVHDRQELLEAACRIAVDSGTFPVAWVGLIDEQTQRVIPVAHSGTEEECLRAVDVSPLEMPDQLRPVSVAVSTGEHCIWNDIEHDEQGFPFREQASGKRYHSSAAFPLKIESRVIGAFAVSATEAGFFLEAEVRLLDELSGNLSFALGAIEQEERRRRAEEALIESEERYRRLAENAPDFIYRYELQPARHFSYVGPAVTHIVGYTPEELYANPHLVRELIHQEDSGPFTSSPGADRTPNRGTVTWTHKNGNTIWVAFRNTLIRDAAGELIAVEGIARDITERKAAEERIRFQASLLDQVGSAAVAVDLKGRVTYWNRQAEMLYQWEAEEAIGKQLAELTVPAPGYQAGVQIVQTLARLRHWQGEFLVRRRDGTAFPALVTDATVEDSEGNVCGYVGISTDITERKKMEDALRESEYRYRRLFTSVSQPIAIYDIDTLGILDVNEAAIRQYGYDREEFLKLKLTDLSAEPDATAEAVKLLAAEGTLTVPVRYHKKKDGTIFPIEASGGVFQVGSRRLGISAQKDITERKRAEDSHRFLAAASKLFSSSLDHRSILSSLVEISLPTLGDGCAIELVGEAGFENLAIYHTDPKKQTLLKGLSALPSADEARANLVRQVLDSGAAVLFSDIKEADLLPAAPDGECLDALLKAGLKSVMAAPMIARDRPFGAIIWVITDSDRRYDSVDLALAEELAQRAALAVDNARLFEDEQTSARRLRDLSRQLLEARENERRSIARELHDEVGQSLTALKLSLGASLRTTDPAGPSLREAQSTVDELLDRVRNLSLDLRPTLLDDLGLLPALMWFLGRYRIRTGVQVNFKHDGIEGERFAAEIETAAYRIIQESLTNVARHSGVDHAEVRVWANTESLGLQVGDGGAGFDLERVLSRGQSTGLFGMRERVRLQGGLLTIEASPRGGSRLTALLPLGTPRSPEERE